MKDGLHIAKLYYTISEVGEQLDISTSQIRYWESVFTQLKPAKSSRGDRKFMQRDIDLLTKIKHLLKDDGYTIEGAKKLLDQEKLAANVEKDVVKRLKALRAQIIDLRDRL
jgi:DNA-binding transcriptional MerR regulator